MKYLLHGIMAALAICILSFAAGCGNNEDNGLLSLLPVVATSQCPDITLPAGATLIRKGGVSINGQRYCYYDLELQYDDHEPSYAMWIPPVSGLVRPAVLMTRPYDYISWNGDRVPWGSEMSARDYVEEASLFMLNDIGVLNVFERYYAGGSIQNDVDDTVAGYRFLNEATDLVNKARIGTWGGSWGGFEALYGAAYSSDGGGMVPKAGVAFYPLSDFQDEVEYIETAAGGTPNSIPDITDDTKRAEFQDFFAPYLTRIRATTDTDGFTDWTGASLAAKLATPFVVVHDEWDTLVPFEQTAYLVNNDVPDGLVTPLYFHQATQRDLNELPWGWGHGELREIALDSTPPPVEGIVYGISNTLASAYLLTQIAPPAQAQIYIGYDEVALADFISYIKTQKCDSGKNMGWAAQLLQNCTDTRVQMINMPDFSATAGAQVIAGAFNTADWGAEGYRKPANVHDALGTGLPVCPVP
jgi:hypothetical protein